MVFSPKDAKLCGKKFLDRWDTVKQKAHLLSFVKLSRIVVQGSESGVGIS